ncbi:transglycosylase domain-containing protein [Agromyces larvae]|uniref:Transglycosylase domain-containing protein n=1 Tax=Agromyces larvae TaxID=2929802 RepID=A0ABY4BXF0_9MICO|nr:transglycosylase domain-containing protein [Agromyces larvae]UOE43848.1 transglycosylase domain-containing protein [Agromyces larvae]
MAGLGGLIGFSAIAGVLISVAVTPAIAVGGMASNSAISMFENLPAYLEIPELAEKTNIYATGSDGSTVLLASFFEQDREQVSWEDVSQFAKDAAIAGEDPRFYEHGGVDLRGTVRAALRTSTGGDVQGGSSISQQYVKNVLVQRAVLTAASDADRTAAVEAATETTPARKLKEMRLAIGLEKRYSKDQILLGYLNIALFGGRVYGIQSAARYYFSTDANALTLEQSAALLAIVNNPEKFRLDRPDSESNGAANGYAATKERRDYILRAMLDEQKISVEQFDAAVAAPIVPVISPPSTGCSTAGDSAYFCDFVYWTLRNDPALGATEEERVRLLERGGLDVYTTLDLDLQAAAVQALEEYVPKSDPRLDLGAVSVSVEVGTGRVLQMAQNKVFSNDPEVLESDPKFSAINYNTDSGYGGSSGFQPGSTYKVFTLGEWLNEGHSLNENVDARRRADWGSFTDSCNGPQSYGTSFTPRNDEGGNGGIWSAYFNTVNSENTGFIAMAKKLDLCGVRRMAESFGVHRADGDPLVQSAATVLGTNEIAPLTMANAFAGIAAGGLVCVPVVIDRIVAHDGIELQPPSAQCRQNVDPTITSGMAYAMQGVMTEGTGGTSNRRTDPRVPMIGKTGTTDNAEATWMSGASTRVATTVGVFNASGHVNLRETALGEYAASDIRHLIWPRIMSTANLKYGGGDFPQPDPRRLEASRIAVPDVRGASMAQALTAIEAAGFFPYDAGVEDSDLPVGQVSRTDPAGQAPLGSQVAVFASSGNLTVVPSVSRDPERAKAETVAAGLVPEFAKTTVTESDEVDQVVSTEPAAGTAIRRGERVRIFVGEAEAKGN